MKKAIVGLALISSFSFANAEDVKSYWDAFYPQIKACVLDEIKSKTAFKPAIPVESDADLRAYLKALDYKDFVVVVETLNYPSSDVCYIKYVAHKIGYNPVFYSSVEKLVIASFPRETDALILKQKLEKEGIKGVKVLDLNE